MFDLKAFAAKHLTVFVYKAVYWRESSTVNYGGKQYIVKPHPTDQDDFLIFEIPESPAREPKLGH